VNSNPLVQVHLSHIFPQRKTTAQSAFLPTDGGLFIHF
jgi:hypothetical protein